jgi:molybdate transport system substrate-binding protein
VAHGQPGTRVNRRRLLLHRVRVLRAALFAALLLGSGTSPAREAEPPPTPAPLVAAASDLQFALDEIVEQFRRATGTTVRVTYGSSGNFARQIEQGAPFELFLSADELFVQRLAQRGLTRGRGELYAIGRIVLFVPNGSPLAADPQLTDVATRLASGKLGRLAIANPEHAPYGRAAQQALRALGLWEQLQPHLLFGENVAQAAQFASSGNADGGLIAYSLALSPPLQGRGSFALLPESLHAPLRQRMVLLERATPAAAQLYDYLRSQASGAILARYGFVVPET